MPHRQGGRQNWVPKTVTRSGSQVVIRPSARGKRNFRLLKQKQRKTGEGRREEGRKERERMGERERKRKTARQAGRKEGKGRGTY